MNKLSLKDESIVTVYEKTVEAEGWKGKFLSLRNCIIKKEDGKKVL